MTWYYCIGTAHGSTIKFNSSISSQVVGLTIVDGMGNVQKITDLDDLRSFRINLGVLGKRMVSEHLLFLKFKP